MKTTRVCLLAAVLLFCFCAVSTEAKNNLHAKHLKNIYNEQGLSLAYEKIIADENVIVKQKNISDTKSKPKFPKKCLYLLEKIKGKKHHTIDEINVCLNKYKLFEGDIVLSQSQENIMKILLKHKNDSKEHRISKRGASKGLKRWDQYLDSDGNKILPYVIDSELDEDAQKAIEVAAQAYERFTCIRLKQRTNEDTYIKFVKKEGCFSNVGRQYDSGPQEISIGSGCEHSDTVLHETLHALGFWHEQSRPDRDSYINIKSENILPGEEVNFEKYDRGKVDSFGSPYDTLSIMHYDSYAFSKNKKPTIVDKNDQPIRTSKEFTKQDIFQVNKMYECGISNEICLKSDLPQVKGNGDIIEIKDKYDAGEKVNLECADGYSPEGPTSATCENEGFTPPTLTCKKDNNEVDCRNLFDACDDWANMGLCTNNYKDFMKRNCKKSCNLCSEEVICSDNQSDCLKWKDQGYCDYDPYKAFMAQECAKSCDSCGVCEDFTQNCGWYLDNNYCSSEVHQRMMKYLCPKTCDYCTYD